MSTYGDGTISEEEYAELIDEYFERNYLLLEFIQRWCVSRASDPDIKKLLERHEAELYVDK